VLDVCSLFRQSRNNEQTQLLLRWRFAETVKCRRTLSKEQYDMSIDIKMPQLGESVTEGTVSRWLKQPGDSVAKYESLLEVVTDKVDTEVPAPVAGTLAEILVHEGETVHVGTVIARMGDSAAATAPTTTDRTTAAPSRAPVATQTETVNGQRKSYLSPVVARLVGEHGIDPAQIPATGQGGRVTKQDVLRYIEARKQTPAPAEPAPAPTPTINHPVTRSPGRPTTPADPSPVVPAPASELPADAELVPLSPMRRSIAEHMIRSVQTAPHVTTVMEVDLSRVMAHRERNKAAFARQGVRLTFTPYFVQAAVAGLQAVPILNGSFSEQGIVMHQRINIGVAVALDEGLIVPVITDADEKNLLGLARAVNDLSERARGRRLKPDETQGGTFTVTNHGTSGSLFATPIINQPQSGILGVGAIVKRPMVVSQDGVDAIAIKPMCYLSLTFDHRIADGAVGDAFLGAIKQALERIA
jgi:2-oxoisovalerate dehydrogenase E2 component (dihydrolipoyl transacylase)